LSSSSVTVCSVEISEFCDEDGVRFSMEDSRRRFPGGIVGSLHFGWKSRNNHFVSCNDLVTKGNEHILCNCTQIWVVFVIVQLNIGYSLTVIIVASMLYDTVG